MKRSVGSGIKGCRYRWRDVPAHVLPKPFNRQSLDAVREPVGVPLMNVNRVKFPMTPNVVLMDVSGQHKNR